MFNTIKVNNTDTNYTHSIFDISEYTGKKYDTLSDALTDVPDGKQSGGMTVRFVSTSGHKYAQYRLVSQNFSANASKWELYNPINTSDQYSSDLDFSDENGNILVRFQNGHIKTKNFDSSKNATEEERGLMSSTDKAKLNTIEQGAEVNDVETFNQSLSDLDLADDNGNVLVRFKDGHIKTKRFDSTFANRFYGKYLSVLGDSISTYYGYSQTNTYPRGDVTNVNQMYWKIVADFFGMQICRINAISGSTVVDIGKTQVPMASDARTSDLHDGSILPDLIIIEGGINDFYNKTPLGTWDGNSVLSNSITNFREAYANMLRKIEVNYPHAQIACLIPPLNWHSGYVDTVVPANADGVYFTKYIEAISQVAPLFGAKVISLLDCGINVQNMFDYTGDSVSVAAFHPNRAGMELYANTIINKLI